MEPSFESVQNNEGSSFSCFRVQCNDLTQDHGWHYHPEYELILHIKGGGTCFVGDSVESYSSGDMMLIGPNLPHCWHSSPLCADEASELIVIQFDLRCFGEGFMELPESSLINRLLRNASRGLSIRGDTALVATRIIKELSQQQSMEKLLSLISLLNSLARSDDLQVLATPDYNLHADINETNRRRIERIYDFVRSNIGNEIHQPEIAERVGLTSQGFSRFFKNATGLTFVKFVNMIRINEACRLLVRENLDITQIAYICGYQNISNFNRRFQALKGTTPSDFRHSHRPINKLAFVDVA
jgi:AraC-like DNA-binding protein/quercetin dioxygenase-like cupin family protein